MGDRERDSGGDRSDKKDVSDKSAKPTDSRLVDALLDSSAGQMSDQAYELLRGTVLSENGPPTSWMSLTDPAFKQQTQQMVQQVQGMLLPQAQQMVANHTAKTERFKKFAVALKGKLGKTETTKSASDSLENQGKHSS